MAQQIFVSSTKLSARNDFGQQRHAAGLVTVAPEKKWRSRIYLHILCNEQFFGCDSFYLSNKSYHAKLVTFFIYTRTL